MTSSDLRSITFFWEDNSDDENGFQLEVLDGEEWIFPGFFGGDPIPADTVQFTVSTTGGGFTVPPGSEWRVRAINAADELSESSNQMTAFAFEFGVSVDGYHRCAIGDPVDIPVTFVGALEDPIVTVHPLPTGVTFDPETNTITGTPTEGGFFAATITARAFVNERKGSVALVVIDPPEVIGSSAPVGLSGAMQDLDLSTVFDDPDTETTAAIETNMGDIPITLFDAAAPITTDNFKGYMDRGDWANSIIHRSVPAFVIQGGWLKPDDQSGKSFVTTSSQPPIADEYDDSRPNAASTLSMAKNGPGEATTNWFIGLRDNAQNLDFQAGGFASFARVIGDGMTVTAAIDALTDDTYPRDPENDPEITINGGSTSIDNLPLQEVTAESPIESQLVIVTSVKRIDPLAFELVSNSSPIVVSATLEDGTLTLGFLPGADGTGGESTITVAATDLDGARTEHSFTATSQVDYAIWAGIAAASTTATDNTDGGILNDLQDYAFMGDPTSAVDDTAVAPALVEVDVEGEAYDAITFYHHRFASDISYTVQSTTDLAVWDDLWTSADGPEAELVAQVEELGNFRKLTVRNSPNRSEAGERVFFRVLVTLLVEE